MTNFSNVEDGINAIQIADSGDYLIEREGQWYWWLGSTSPRENFGPHATQQAAMRAYAANQKRAGEGGK